MHVDACCMTRDTDTPNVRVERRSRTAAIIRYNLTFPAELYGPLESVAERRHTTPIDSIRQFVKLGLYVDKIDQDPDADLLVREAETVHR